MKNKYLLFAIFLVAFLLLGGGFIQALEITSYPTIPGYTTPNPSCTGSTCLPILIGYWFGALVYIAGFIALISFAIGAIMLISPNPESHSDAKDRMKGAILGLVLTLASAIIIKTININLATFTLTPLAGVQGVFYWNGSEEKPVGQEVADVSARGADLISQGFNSIKYDCGTSTTAPKLLLWGFPKAGLENGNTDLSNVPVQEVSCGGTPSISGFGSFRVAFQTPGIYYYLDSGCSKYASMPNTSSQGDLGDPFRGKIKGIKIVNDSTNSVYYGALFHKQIGLENAGACSTKPITDEGCQKVDISDAYAADIFQLNKTPGSSGDGVTFYSEPFGWDAGANAGSSEVGGTSISSPYTTKTGAGLTFSYGHVNQTNTYQAGCKTFYDCNGSIKIKGNYLVAVYSKSGEASGDCQTFTSDVTDMYAQPILPHPTKSFGNIYIIPTK